MRSGASWLPLCSRWPLTLDRRPDGSRGCEISALICSASLCVQRWQIYCKVAFVSVQSPSLQYWRYWTARLFFCTEGAAPSSVQWQNTFKQDPVCHFKCMLANSWLKTVTDWLSVIIRGQDVSYLSVIVHGYLKVFLPFYRLLIEIDSDWYKCYYLFLYFGFFCFGHIHFQMSCLTPVLQ